MNRLHLPNTIMLAVAAWIFKIENVPLGCLIFSLIWFKRIIFIRRFKAPFWVKPQYSLTSLVAECVHFTLLGGGGGVL